MKFEVKGTKDGRRVRTFVEANTKTMAREIASRRMAVETVEPSGTLPTSEPASAAEASPGTDLATELVAANEAAVPSKIKTAKPPKPSKSKLDPQERFRRDVVRLLIAIAFLQVGGIVVYMLVQHGLRYNDYRASELIEHIRISRELGLKADEHEERQQLNRVRQATFATDGY